jgi:hypothetical protein
VLVERGYIEIQQGRLVDTYARSKFEDTRRKAAKFGAMGSTIRATKPPGGSAERGRNDQRGGRKTLPATDA